MQPWVIHDTGWFWNNMMKFNLLLLLWTYTPLFRTFNDDAYAQWLCAHWVGSVDDIIAVRDTGISYCNCACRKTVHRGGMNEWMDGWMFGWMNEWMDEWVSGCMNGWMDEWISGCMNEWMDGWMNEWVDGWMNEWIDGWISGWMNEWMDGWMN
jgi:organic anion transporter 5A